MVVVSPVEPITASSIRVVIFQYSGTSFPAVWQAIDKTIRFLLVKNPKLKASDLGDIIRVFPYMRIVMVRENGTKYFLYIGDFFSPRLLLFWGRDSAKRDWCWSTEERRFLGEKEIRRLLSDF